ERGAQQRPGVRVLVSRAPRVGDRAHRLVLEREPRGPSPAPSHAILADLREDVHREELPPRALEHYIDHAIEVEDRHERHQIGACFVVRFPLELEPAYGCGPDHMLENDVADLVGDDVEILAVRLPRVPIGEAELDIPLAGPRVVSERAHSGDDLELPLAAPADERYATAKIELPDFQDAADRRVGRGRREGPASRLQVVEVYAGVRADGALARPVVRVRRAPEVLTARRVAIRCFADRVDHADPAILGSGADGSR